MNQSKQQLVIHKRNMLAEYHAFTIGSRIADRREKIGLTQEDISSLTGLKPTAISHFERGRRRPCIKNLLLLCFAFKCSPNELLLGDNLDKIND